MPEGSAEAAVSGIWGAKQCLMLGHSEKDQWNRHVGIGKRTEEFVLQTKRKQHSDKNSAPDQVGIDARVPMSKRVKKLVGKQAYSFTVRPMLPPKQI